MKVEKLPMDPGPAGWNAILPPQTGYPELEGAQTADWLVIGAGFAGLAAARRLKQLHPKDRIVILEARRVAHGPAGRNSGFMIDLPHNLTSEDYGGALEADRKHARLNRAAIDFNAGAAGEYGLSEEAFCRPGKTNAAATEKGLQHNRTYSAHLTRLGEAHDMLDARQMKEMTGSDFYQGGLYTPGAALIQPAMFVRGVAEGLARQGVELFEMSPVTQLDREGSGWRAEMPKGRISAAKVILAVNGHVESFGFFRRRLIHIYLYASFTRRLTADEVKSLRGEPRWGVTPADPLGSTVRRISGTGGNRIVVRNRVSYHPGRECSEAKVAAFGQSHDKSFAARFPMLKGVDMEHRWGGQLCLAWNGAPAFGELEQNLYSACCQNGLGTAKGTLSGMLAAELASGRRSQNLTDMLAEPEPSRLPPEPFCWIGATAQMRWGEFKAGAEL
jgi:glycine/D-amino acid oxidase-like deaminating enzyme